MSEDLKSKSVILYDHGLFVPLAERLSREFGRVAYFCDWRSGFPDGTELTIGSGIEGVDRIRDFWSVADDYDLIVFPDCQDGDMQCYLRKHGYRVFGSGEGSRLELLRWWTHLQLPKWGLPQNHAVKVVGTTALRKYLQDHQGVFVKVSTMRGLTETFCSPSYEEVKPTIDEMDVLLGPRQSLQEFIIEDEIPDCDEIGFDGFSIDGQFANTSAWGVEKKDAAYAEKICSYDALPEGVRRVNDGLAPAMKEMQYRNFFSTEIRERDGEPFLIDATCRHPSPPGECEHELYANLGEIMWHGAEGKLIEPEPIAKFAAQLILKSDFAEDNWMPVRFPKEVARAVKLYRSCVIDGLHYVAPCAEHSMSEIGSVVGLGESPEEAKAACIEVAEQVSGAGLKFDADALEAAFADLEKAG